MRTMDVDSEDDSDYVPSKDHNAGSDASDNEEPQPKRVRTDAPSDTVSATLEDTANKKTGDDVYAAFKASLTSTPFNSSPEPAPSTGTVKIVKRYRYAGEEITEVKEVPVDSDEAKQWPRWQPSDDAETASSSKTPSTSAADGTPSAASTSASTGAALRSPANTPGKRPGPRKAKNKLADIPTKKEPVKRLTTLDKSAMDWRAHINDGSSAAMKDELEANRRGGGYLEKVEFMQRVEARKEEVLDASKGKRRR